MQFIERSSPNFDERNPNIPLKYIILHYTGMKSRDEALDRLCDPAAKVSAHYVIDETGAVYRLLPEGKRAWHAGKSFWQGITDINSASIGIELVNPGHEFGYVSFPKKQIESLKTLLADIIARNKFAAATCLLGHSDVAPLRKMDPGELFPWQDLAANGFGFFPAHSDTETAGQDYSKLMQLIGYDVSDVGAALLAFQRRYDPDNLTGKPEQQTLRRLYAVAKSIKQGSDR